MMLKEIHFAVDCTKTIKIEVHSFHIHIILKAVASNDILCFKYRSNAYMPIKREFHEALYSIYRVGSSHVFVVVVIEICNNNNINVLVWICQLSMW